MLEIPATNGTATMTPAARFVPATYCSMLFTITLSLYIGVAVHASLGKKSKIRERSGK